MTLDTEGLAGDKGRRVALDEGVDGAHEGGVGCVTIEVDEDLATHRAHKRNIEELETDQHHEHDHHHH